MRRLRPGRDKRHLRKAWTLTLHNLGLRQDVGDVAVYFRADGTFAVVCRLPKTIAQLDTLIDNLKRAREIITQRATEIEP